jgi:hypothetical protein
MECIKRRMADLEQKQERENAELKVLQQRKFAS